MKTALVTGPPLEPQYVAEFEQLGFRVINGSESAQRGLGIDNPKPELTEAQLSELLPGVAVYVYGGLEPATRSALERASDLELIAFLGTGWSDPGCVDAEAARALNIRVSNTAHANARSTAEMAIAMLLAVERQIVPMNRSMFDGRKEPIRRRDVVERTLGIVGLGHVGSTVAKIAAHGLGMNVVYHGPRQKPDAESLSGASRVSLEQLCTTSDYISIHSPASETLGLIGQDELMAMNDETILVNTSAPEIVDGEHLVSKLENKALRGLAMDGIYEDEALATRLRSMESGNVLLTPRAAWLTHDSYRRMAEMALESVVDLHGDSFPVRHQVSE